ncbi:MAG: hypothetical protein EBT17_04020 [Actinobacteria bacterium]|jgi:hypothetical protein|nr:hypothetical protein [Actinomycetota bacterium]NBO32873.1 hypothetical protein [Actinomycetota bacterium]NBP17448.1 hypothetical protein [Actinomycetota bacterium]NBR76076.1 hypothetical protein [Actinomycetota bacterium]NBR92185.1 hypothetical protein [Actinomycetota bacterium]
MHPIERLRYVARADGAGPSLLVRETAHALCDLDTDPQSLILACRRIVERHPTMAQLWWLCANVLTATEPFARARELAHVVERDPTPGHLDDDLPDDASVLIIGWPSSCVKTLVQRGDATMLVVDSHGEGEALVNRLHDAEVAAELVPFEYLAGVMRSVDAVLIEALACGPDSVLCVGGSRTVVDVARAHDKAVTLVAGVGTRLPDPLWRGMVDALVLDDWRAGLDVIDARVFARIVGPTGVSTDFSKSFVAECAAATELLRRSVI